MGIQASSRLKSRVLSACDLGEYQEEGVGGRLLSLASCFGFFRSLCGLEKGNAKHHITA